MWLWVLGAEHSVRGSVNSGVLVNVIVPLILSRSTQNRTFDFSMKLFAALDNVISLYPCSIFLFIIESISAFKAESKGNRVSCSCWNNLILSVKDIYWWGIYSEVNSYLNHWQYDLFSNWRRPVSHSPTYLKWDFLKLMEMGVWKTLVFMSSLQYWVTWEKNVTVL